MKQLAKSILELNERYVRNSNDLLPTKWIKDSNGEENQIGQLTNDINNLSLDLKDSFKTSHVIIYDETNMMVTVDNFQKIANKEPTYLPIVIEALDSFKDQFNPLIVAPQILSYVNKRIEFHQAIYKKTRDISSHKVDVLFKSMNYDIKEVYPVIKTYLFHHFIINDRERETADRQASREELRLFLADRDNFKKLLECISSIGFTLISSNSTYTGFLPEKYFSFLRSLIIQYLGNKKVEFGSSIFYNIAYKDERK